VRANGSEERIPCDVLILSLGISPRDGLLRMGDGEPVLGAGDVVAPGCTPEEAQESGRRAGLGDEAEPRAAATPSVRGDGYVCLCEDVSHHDLERAWDEGYRSSEILKRYTTATMGPCQGAMCALQLARFAARHAGGASRADPAHAGIRPTARPPARPVALETLAAGVHEVIEKRTALHDAHLELGAHLDWSGGWKRPFRYGDWREEYRAVRERVSVMDVGTLGKFLVAGRDASTLADFVFPCRVDDLTPGRSRYALVLDEAGYVVDDGVLCALEGGRWYITSTSGGSERLEAWMRNWADRLALRAHIVNQTAQLGAILVAGPRARDVVGRLTDDRIDRKALAYGRHAEIVVAGVACRALRVGFVGELAFELHHPRSHGVELWTALLEAGRDVGIRPHGLDALELLRLEKGHLYIGQDSLPDDTPAKLGLGWAVSTDKGSFVGKVSLERMAERPVERKLVGLRFDGDGSTLRGAPLSADGRVVGRVTSFERSDVLGGKEIGLGWITAIDGRFAKTFRVGHGTAAVAPTPFYDPGGARLRA
jgi:sarcosine oxidase, subunit alpha